jgi:hypothetical protein
MRLVRDEVPTDERILRELLRTGQFAEGSQVLTEWQIARYFPGAG